MPAQHHLRLFGVPQLLVPGGAVLRLRTRKQLALLVYLALEGKQRPVLRDVLVDLFWPHAPHERGRHSLSQALSAIRRLLGRQAVSRSAETVRLLADLSTDLDSTALEELAHDELLHPLEGLDGCAGPAFAHWVDGIRARCRLDVRRLLLNELADARARGQVRQVHERAALLYTVDPLCSTAVLALAEQHLLDHDSAGAVRVLSDHKSRAEGEFGHQPDPEVDRLLCRIDRGLVQHTPAELRLGSARDEPVTITAPFVGREAELAQLEAAWRAAMSGTMRTCMLTGPAGIGKSSLLHRFGTSVATRTWPVFSVVCEEIGKNIPFAVISDLIYRLSREPAFGTTDPIWLAEASRLAPRLNAMYPGIPDVQPAAAEAVRLRIAEAIEHIIESVADGGPILLSLDDVQYIDTASRDVLHLVSRRLESTPTLVLATTRTDDDIAAGLGTSRSGVQWNECLCLRPLSPRLTKELTRQLSEGDSPGEHVCTQIAELSQGNPYLVEMLLSDWRRDPEHSLVHIESRRSGPGAAWRPPETMRLAFARQHHEISALARHTLHLLAVASRAMPTDEIATILAADPHDIHRAALELLDRGTVRFERGAFGFKNQLHRAFVYYGMSEEAQRYHHSRLAQSLTVFTDTEDFQAALEAAHHFLEAGMVREGADATCRGAEMAITRGAPREAEAALTAAIARGATEPTLHLLLARALGAHGRYREGLNALSAWRPRSRTPLDEAWAALVRAEALHRGRLADDESIDDASRRALKLAEACGEERLVMRALQTCAEVASDLGKVGAVAALGQKAVKLAATSTRRETRAQAHLTQGFCHLMAGELQSAIVRFQESIRALEQLSLDMELRQALNGLGFAHSSAGRTKKAITAFLEGLAVADRIGDTAASAIMCSNIATTYADLGRFVAAGRWLRRALALEEKATNPRRSAQIHLNTASLQMAIGDLQQAYHHIQLAQHQAVTSQLWKLKADVLLFKADYKLACEEPETSWQLLEEVERIAAGRESMLFSTEKLQRLRRHRLWKTRGYAAMTRAVDATDLGTCCVPIVKQLEVRAFEEWVKQIEGVEGASLNGVIKEIQKYQFNGLLAFLKVLHIALE